MYINLFQLGENHVVSSIQNIIQLGIVHNTDIRFQSSSVINVLHNHMYTYKASHSDMSECNQLDMTE